MELRWHPILEEWVAIAAHRQERPQLPGDWCPFCPQSGKLPKDYDVYVYPNDFPALVTPAPAPAISSNSLFQVADSVGVCDVILYHRDHNTQLAHFPRPHMMKLVRLWQQRFRCRAERFL